MVLSLEDSQSWRRVGTAVLGVYVVYRLGRKVQHKIRQRGLYRAIQARQKSCAQTFQTVEMKLGKSNLSEEAIERIMSLELSALIQEMQTGKLTVIDVLHAYQSQTMAVHKDTNCVTQFLTEAEEMARSCDSADKKDGPLFGVPVSVKENFDLAGEYTTLGLASMLNNKREEDAVLVKVLKDLGAIPYVRTNVPQTLMIYETSNPIFGRTNHPQDNTRGPGGSTGGEAALIGAGASVLGFGTDIGGSIRVPCHFCGLYGLKTTVERLSRKGSTSLSKGQTLVTGTAGPMARDLDGLVLTMKAILSDYHFQLDPQVPPIKFRDEIYSSKKPLRVGFYLDNGYVQAVPACERAVLLAKQALEAQGHTVVSFTPPRVGEVLPVLYYKSVQGDGGRVFLENLKNDIIDPTINQLMSLKKVWKCCQWPLTYILQKLARDPNFGKSLRSSMGFKTVYGWWQHAIEIQAYKDEWLAEWQGAGIDALICPVFATTAIPHGKVVDVLSCGTYSMLYNVLNYPAGSVPVTTVIEEDIDNMKDYPRKTWVQKSVHQVTAGSEGLPVGVQCVGLPFQEELVLRVMKEIETGLAAASN